MRSRIASRTMAALPLVAALLAGCAPIEIAASDDGVLAWVSDRGLVVTNAGGAVPRTLPAARLPSSLAISRDGTRLCYAVNVADGVSALVVRPAAGGEETEVARVEGAVRFPRWSADGSWIGYVADRNGVFENPQRPQELSLRAVRLGADDRVAERRLLLESCGLWHDWSRQGVIAAVRVRKGKTPLDLEPSTIVTITLDGSGPVPRLDVVGGDFSHLRFSHDGRTLHFCAPSVEYPAIARERLDGKRGKTPFAHHAFDLESGTVARVSGPLERVYVAVPAPASGDVLFVDAAEGGMLRGRVCLRDGRTHEIRELGLNEAEVVPFFIGADRVGFIEKDGAGERIAVRDLEGNAVSLRHELPRLAPPITRAP